MKRLLIALLLLALTGGAVVWFLRVREPRNAPITLSDGTVLVFRGATYGTVHEYHGGGWRNRVAQLLPEKLAKRLRKGGSKVTSAQPSLTVWFERQGGANKPTGIQYVLGTGTHFAPVNTAHGLSSGLPGGSSIEGVGFNTFPRRGRTITLRFYEGRYMYIDGGASKWVQPRLAGEFTFRNPARSDAPGWQPESLPATKRIEDFDVTLKELLVGVDRNLVLARAATNPADSGARAVLSFSRAGKPLDEWRVLDLEMSDATGNKATLSGWGGNARGQGVFEMPFASHLWLDESAWKLRFELCRTTNFAPEELWVLRGLPLGATNLTQYQTNLHGVGLQVVELDQSANKPDAYNLRIRVTPPPMFGSGNWISSHRGFRLYRTPAQSYNLIELVTARDEHGREAEVLGMGTSTLNQVAEFHFGLMLATNAQRLDVTLALHRSRYVEFLVAPKPFPPASGGAQAGK